MHKYIILNWVKTKVFSFIYVIDVQYYVNFRCQIAVYILHYKMITTHLVHIYSTWNCYSIIDHIPCCINNCILVAYLFCNWRSVPLTLLHLFLPHPHHPSLWEASICSLYLWVCFVLFCFFRFCLSEIIWHLSLTYFT